MADFSGFNLLWSGSVNFDQFIAAVTLTWPSGLARVQQAFSLFGSFWFAAHKFDDNHDSRYSNQPQDNIQRDPPPSGFTVVSGFGTLGLGIVLHMESIPFALFAVVGGLVEFALTTHLSVW
jgi:hypothetical protein